MTLVLDTSSAVEFILNRPNAPAIESYLYNANRVITPELYVAELANVLWKYVHFKQMSKVKASNFLELALELPDEIMPGKEFAAEAFSMACVSQHSAYDLFFILLARRNNATVLTLDTKLAKLAKQLDVQIFMPTADA